MNDLDKKFAIYAPPDSNHPWLVVYFGDNEAPSAFPFATEFDAGLGLVEKAYELMGITARPRG